MGPPAESLSQLNSNEERRTSQLFSCSIFTPLRSPVDLKAEQLERLSLEDDDDEDKDDDDEAVEMSGINSSAWLSQAFTVEIGGLGGESANQVRGTS